jgi:hypothetical protein
MQNAQRALVGLVLFLGVGVVARYCFQEWVVSAVQQPLPNGTLDPMQWKAMDAKFVDIKVGQSIGTMPTFEVPQQKVYPNRR